MPKSRLIVQNECLQAPGKIARKAMVINSLDYIQSGGGVTAVKLRPPHLRLAPEPDGTDKRELRFFDVYFVWADTNPGEDKRGYALLGRIPNFNQNSTLNTDQWRDRTLILGWVEKSRLCFWRTREAIQWDDDPDPKAADRAGPRLRHAGQGPVGGRPLQQEGARPQDHPRTRASNSSKASRRSGRGAGCATRC